MLYLLFLTGLFLVWVCVHGTCSREISYSRYSRYSRGPPVRRCGINRANMTAFWGEAALFISSLSYMSAIPQSRQAILTALYRYIVLLRPPYIGIPPYSDRRISGYCLTQTTSLGPGSPIAYTWDEFQSRYLSKQGGTQKTEALGRCRRDFSNIYISKS